MGRFSGLAGVKTNSKGVWFLDGDYVVDIEKIKFFNSRSGDDTFVIEAKIVESTNPERVPGTVCTYMITFKKEFMDTCLGDLKHVSGQILGFADPDAYHETPRPGETQEEADERFWDEAVEALVSDDQPAREMRMRLNVVSVPKKTKPGEMFGKHTWSQYKAA